MDNKFARGLFAVVMTASISLLAPSVARADDNETGATDGPSSRALDAAAKDPFLRSFERSLRAPRLPFVVKDWGTKILEGQEKGNTREAMHLFSAVQREAPDSFMPTARAAQLYLLWQNKLPQTFFNEWSGALNDAGFAKSEARRDLERSLEIPVADWLAANPIALSDRQQEAVLKNAPESWTKPFRARTGADALAYVRASRDYSFAAVERAALYLADQKKTEAALSFLDDHGPQSLGPRATTAERTRFKMLRARFLYQLGSVREAVKAYGLIDRNDESFPEVVEERSWALARAGDYDRLRGDLASINRPIYKNYFGPEALVLRAILELKLCQYQDVSKTFESFNTEYRPWATKISAALKANPVPAAPWTDTYLKRSEDAERLARDETKTLRTLETESVGAPLTAVGQQSHWATYRREADESLATANRELQSQRARVWRSRGEQLSEAIRKMRFVKVEVMSQVSLKLTENLGNQDGGKVAHVGSGWQVYPYEEGELWPDELFRIRSLTNTACPVAQAR